MIDWSNEFDRVFGDYLSEGKSEEWESVKYRLIKDKEVSGTVVAKAPFGLWIDIGVMFPALLEVILIEGMEYESYLKDNAFPPGLRINAKISGIRDHKRQIYLHRLDWPFKVNEATQNT